MWGSQDTNPGYCDSEYARADTIDYGIDPNGWIILDFSKVHHNANMIQSLAPALQLGPKRASMCLVNPKWGRSFCENEVFVGKLPDMKSVLGRS